MKLTCNIDARGCRIRGISGTIVMLLAVLLALAVWLTGWNWLWWPVAGCALAAAAQLFEAANGWCVLRAIRGKIGI